MESSGIGESGGLLENRSSQNQTGRGRTSDTGNQVGSNEGDHQGAALVGKNVLNSGGVSGAVLNDGAKAHDSGSIDDGGHAHVDGVGQNLAVDIPLAGQILELADDNSQNAAEQGGLNLDLEDVQNQNGDQHGDNGQEPVRTSGVFIQFLLVLHRAGAIGRGIAQTLGGQAILIPLHVEDTDCQEHDVAEQSQQTAGADIGAEVAGAEDVIGNRDPRQSQAQIQAQGETGNNNSTVHICFAAQLKSNGVNDEDGNEAGNAGSSKDCGEQTDAQRDVLGADPLKDLSGEAVSTAGGLKQLSEQSAQREQNQPGFGKADQAAHVDVQQAVVNVHAIDEHQDQGCKNAAYQSGDIQEAQHANCDDGNDQN